MSYLTLTGSLGNMVWVQGEDARMGAEPENQKRDPAASLPPIAAIFIPLCIGSAVLLVAVFATYIYQKQSREDARRQLLAAARDEFKKCKTLIVKEEFTAAESAADAALNYILDAQGDEDTTHPKTLAQAYFLRGQVRARQRLRQKMIGAQNDLTSSLQYNPDDHEAHCLRAEVRLDLGLLPSAEDDFTTAIRLRSTYARAYAGRAKVRRALGKTVAATADAKRAKALGLVQE